MDRLTKELLENLSLIIKIEKDGILGVHGQTKQGMRRNYYPACCRPDEVVGVSPHSDSSSITVLLQDDDIAALQIKHKITWVPVKPVPNALVGNIGDIIEDGENMYAGTAAGRLVLRKGHKVASWTPGHRTSLPATVLAYMLRHPLKIVVPEKEIKGSI